jgi:hypothetical protein
MPHAPIESPVVTDDAITLWLDRLRAGESAAVRPLWETYFHRLVGLARTRLRTTAHRLAEKHPESAHHIRVRMWNLGYPVRDVEIPTAERQLRLSDAHLRLHPGAVPARLNRAVALYHCGRHGEAADALREFRCEIGKGAAAGIEEGYRLGFLCLALARLEKFDAARTALVELEKLSAAHGDWSEIRDLRELTTEARKAVLIPRANDQPATDGTFRSPCGR